MRTSYGAPVRTTREVGSMADALLAAHLDRPSR
jgi:hypothetical protein